MPEAGKWTLFDVLMLLLCYVGALILGSITWAVIRYCGNLLYELLTKL